MNATVVTFLVVITSFALSFTSACVILECQRPSTTLAPWTFGGINHWLVIFSIVVACLVVLLLLITLVWCLCWCCYRCNADKAPTIVKRIVILRRRQEVKPQIIVAQPPPVQLPPPPPPPPPPPRQPQSLLLTISDNYNQASAGPSLTTLVQRPLTFTITPEYDHH